MIIQHPNKPKDDLILNAINVCQSLESLLESPVIKGMPEVETLLNSTLTVILSMLGK